MVGGAEVDGQPLKRSLQYEGVTPPGVVERFQ